jgi:hypothetical protein
MKSGHRRYARGRDCRRSSPDKGAMFFEVQLISAAVNFPQRNPSIRLAEQDSAAGVVERRPSQKRAVLLKAQLVAFVVHHPEGNAAVIMAP